MFGNPPFPSPKLGLRLLDICVVPSPSSALWFDGCASSPLVSSFDASSSPFWGSAVCASWPAAGLVSGSASCVSLLVLVTTYRVIVRGVLGGTWAYIALWGMKSVARIRPRLLFHRRSPGLRGHSFGIRRLRRSITVHGTSCRGGGRKSLRGRLRVHGGWRRRVLRVLGPGRLALLLLGTDEELDGGPERLVWFAIVR